MKVISTVLASAILLGFSTPALADDGPNRSREYRQHERLERQHHRADHGLERQHAEAHYYGLSRREHREVHHQLEYQHDRTHARLENRHERQHYGRGYGY